MAIKEQFHYKIYDMCRFENDTWWNIGVELKTRQSQEARSSGFYSTTNNNGASSIFWVSLSLQLRTFIFLIIYIAV